MTTENAAPEQPERDLSDAKVQFGILNPETPTYALALDGGTEMIAIPTRFTLADIHTRRVYDDIQSLQQLLTIELGRLRAGDPDPNWLARHIGYIDVVLARGMMRDATREIIAKIAYFVEDDPLDADGNPKPKRRPTPDQILVGMDGTAVSAIAWMLIKSLATEIAKQKNAPGV